MNKVAIVGTGQTKFSKDDKNIEDLLFESSDKCLQSIRNCDPNDVQGVLVSTNDNSKYLGAILSETMGIEPQISHSIEHLCSSGTNAIISAYSYISSGLSDIILVSGVESATNPGQVLEWDKLEETLNIQSIGHQCLRNLIKENSRQLMKNWQ